MGLIEKIFSSRRDIELMISVLNDWLKEHEGDKEYENVKTKLVELEYLHMVW